MLVANKYAMNRRQTLQKHPVAYLYELSPSVSITLEQPMSKSIRITYYGMDGEGPTVKAAKEDAGRKLARLVVETEEAPVHHRGGWRRGDRRVLEMGLGTSADCRARERPSDRATVRLGQLPDPPRSRACCVAACPRYRLAL
jgi:hypothetical protein